MELSSPKIKNFPIFSQKKFFLYFGKWNFLFLRFKNFRREFLEPKKFKKPLWKNFFYFRKWNFLTPSLKNSYIVKKIPILQERTWKAWKALTLPQKKFLHLIFFNRIFFTRIFSIRIIQSNMCHQHIYILLKILEHNSLYFFYELNQLILLIDKHIDSLLSVVYYCNNLCWFFHFRILF